MVRISHRQEEKKASNVYEMCVREAHCWHNNRGQFMGISETVECYKNKQMKAIKFEIH